VQRRKRLLRLRLRSERRRRTQRLRSRCESEEQGGREGGGGVGGHECFTDVVREGVRREIEARHTNTIDNMRTFECRVAFDAHDVPDTQADTHTLTHSHMVHDIHGLHCVAGILHPRAAQAEVQDTLRRLKEEAAVAESVAQAALPKVRTLLSTYPCLRSLHPQHLYPPSSLLPIQPARSSSPSRCVCVCASERCVCLCACVLVRM
jgi:hypothetical protein